MPTPLALAVFYRAEYPRLVAALTLYCGDRELAAELAQEAMARAWRHWARVGRFDSPAAWVHRVGINLANSAMRRTLLGARLARVERPDVATAGPDFATVLLLREAVARLPRRQRTALVLRYFADMSYGEAAALMHCRPGTARALTAQGIEKLRRTASLWDTTTRRAG